MISFRWTYIFITLLSSISHVACLQCYACADTGADNKCEQYETYKDAADGKRPGVMKNCTAPFDQICYVETYSSGGLQVSHIRDCGDGETFSFSFDNADVYQRLYNLTNNNETACTFVDRQQICLSKCNSTDFCNGPLITDVSGVDVILSSVRCLVIFVVVSLFVRER